MKCRLPTLLAGLVLLGTGLIAAPTEAHDARPLSIVIVEQAPGVFRSVVRVPPTVEAENTPGILWAEACSPVDDAGSGTQLVATTIVRCSGNIDQLSITIDYPYFNPSITSLIRLQPLEGPMITAVLPPDQLEWTAPADPTWLTVARDYLALGFHHIWGGPDHLLFVAGILLLARHARKILWAITGFTAAHSITLSLATLGLVRLPITPVEAMIALSILFLAVEIARNEPQSFSHRYPIVLSFAFGLLHGFGFASALGEVGLPRGEVATGLAFFNLGVEVGQIAFIVAAVIAFMTAKTAISILSSRIAPVWRLSPAAAGLAGAYALGVPAAYWFIDRSAIAFGF